jgi:hypothetical protein
MAEEPDKSCGLENIGTPGMSGQGPRHVWKTSLEFGDFGRTCTGFLGGLDIIRILLICTSLTRLMCPP